MFIFNLINLYDYYNKVPILKLCVNIIVNNIIKVKQRA